MPGAGAGPALRTPATSVSRTFAATPASVRLARLLLAELLGASPASADAVLCLSELATNAVLHSASARPGGTFAVHAEATGSGFRVEVCDAGGAWDARPPDENDGHGLAIVAALAARWGVSGSEAARTVWFEIAC